jgi:hypothetical protein
LGYRLASYRLSVFSFCWVVGSFLPSGLPVETICPPEASFSADHSLWGKEGGRFSRAAALDRGIQSHRADVSPMRRAKTLGMGLGNIDQQLHGKFRLGCHLTPIFG